MAEAAASPEADESECELHISNDEDEPEIKLEPDDTTKET